MAKKLIFMLLAALALAACEQSTDIDLEQLERENERILRQLGSD